MRYPRVTQWGGGPCGGIKLCDGDQADIEVSTVVQGWPDDFNFNQM